MEVLVVWAECNQSRLDLCKMNFTSWILQVELIICFFLALHTILKFVWFGKKRFCVNMWSQKRNFIMVSAILTFVLFRSTENQGSQSWHWFNHTDFINSLWHNNYVYGICTHDGCASLTTLIIIIIILVNLESIIVKLPQQICTKKSPKAIIYYNS